MSCIKRSTRYFSLASLLLLAQGLNAATASVDGNVTYQSIRGFGASSAWAGSFTAAQLDALFRADTGIGLTLLRHRIPPDNNFATGASILQGARDRGATIWATCWSPPGNWKNTGSANSTGTNTCNAGNLAYLLPANYQNYANYLASYVTTLKNNYNVDIWAVSPQNEPNWCPNYEGSWFDGNDFLNFIENYMGPTFQAQGLATKIIMPEPINTGALNSLASPCLNDVGCRGYLFAIATHLYGTPASAYAAAASNGKEYWETEISSFEAYDAGMTHGLTTADWIHGSMASNMNAFHYWWAISDNNNEGLLTQTLGTPKRYYVMGNYSKFIRPGFQRVDVPNSPAAGVNLTAYKGVTSCVIVAVNHNAGTVSMTFNLSNLNPSSMVPWITDSTRSLASQPAVTVSGNSFTYTLPGQSVVSFVGAISQGTPTRTPTYAGTSTSTPTPSPTPQSQLFDDFEDVNTANNWGGTWSIYAGAGSAVTVTVSGGGGAPGSTLGRAVVTGNIGDYGGVSATFTGSPRDLSNYVGISFMVKGSGTHWFQIPQTSIADGDNFGASFTATAGWTQVTLYFSSFTQRGFGAASTLNLSQIQLFQWASNANGAFNFEIDDVKLLTYSVPSATPSNTRTASPSPTRSSTTLPSATRSNTPASSPSNTPLATASNTAQPTATRSATPLSSPSNTPLPTISNTTQATATRSSTPLSSPSNTPLATASNTAQPTATRSNTAQPSPTFTTQSTGSATQTPLPSATRSNTSLPSPTSTTQSTGSATQTPFPSATATLASTGSVTNTPLPSPSASPSSLPSATATLQSTGSVTDTPLPSATATTQSTGSATDTPLPSATASPSSLPSMTATLPPTGSVTHTPLPSSSATAQSTGTATQTSMPSPSSTLQATGTATQTGLPSSTRTPSTLPSASPTPSSLPTLAGTATASPTSLATASPTLAATPSSGTLGIDAWAAVPNPNPSGFTLYLTGAADEVKVLIYSKGMTRVLELSGPGLASAGWVWVPLPKGLSAGYYTAVAYAYRAGERSARSKPIHLFIWR